MKLLVIITTIFFTNYLIADDAITDEILETNVEDSAFENRQNHVDRDLRNKVFLGNKNSEQTSLSDLNESLGKSDIKDSTKKISEADEDGSMDAANLEYAEVSDDYDSLANCSENNCDISDFSRKTLNLLMAPLSANMYLAACPESPSSILYTLASYLYLVHEEKRFSHYTNISEELADDIESTEQVDTLEAMEFAKISNEELASYLHQKADYAKELRALYRTSAALGAAEWLMTGGFGTCISVLTPDFLVPSIGVIGRTLKLDSALNKVGHISDKTADAQMLKARSAGILVRNAALAKFTSQSGLNRLIVFLAQADIVSKAEAELRAAAIRVDAQADKYSAAGASIASANKLNSTSSLFSESDMETKATEEAVSSSESVVSTSSCLKGDLSNIESDEACSCKSDKTCSSIGSLKFPKGSMAASSTQYAKDFASNFNSQAKGKASSNIGGKAAHKGLDKELEDLKSKITKKIKAEKGIDYNIDNEVKKAVAKISKANQKQFASMSSGLKNELSKLTEEIKVSPAQKIIEEQKNSIREVASKKVDMSLDLLDDEEILEEDFSNDFEISSIEDVEEIDEEALVLEANKTKYSRNEDDINMDFNANLFKLITKRYKSEYLRPALK